MHVGLCKAVYIFNDILCDICCPLTEDEEKEQLLSKETRKQSQYATIQQSNGPDTSTDSIRQRVFRWLQKYVFCCDLGDEDDGMDLHKVHIHTEGWAFTSNRIRYN